MNRRSIGRLIRGGLGVGALLLASACAPKDGGVDSGAVSRAERVSPEEASRVIGAFNERAERLARIWSVALVEIRYTDDEGQRRWEQGDAGVLQFVAPSRFALTVRKVSETALYVGCDAERFWVFEGGKRPSVTLCRHENAGSACARSLGLPARPLDLIDLLGLRPIGASDGASVHRSPQPGTVDLVLARPRGDLALRLDAKTCEPLQASISGSVGAEGVDGAPALSASMQEYENINIVGPRFEPPRLPARVVIKDLRNDTEIRLHLSDASNGKPGQLPDEAFDLDTLLDAFAPVKFVVLDRDCDTSALPPGFSAGAR